MEINYEATVVKILSCVALLNGCFHKYTVGNRMK